MISTLEDVAEIHDNLREPVNSAERAKRPGSYPYYGATGQVGWIDDYRQDGEYVLLGEDGAPFFEPTKEKAYLVSGKCWVNNHAHVLKGQEGLCSNRYLFYALNQTNYRGYANGTTRLKLTQSAMRQLPINLAPFPEQHRIVAKIEELFSGLDSGLENLKTARAQLKVYRQALLKHAFEGKLTVQWRAENRDKLGTAEALLKRIQQERAERYQQQLADWKNPPRSPFYKGGRQPAPQISFPLKKNELEEIDDSPLCKRGARGDFKPKAPKILPPLTAEELAELPELPEGWIYAYLSDLGDLGRGKSKHRPRNDPRLFGGIYPFVQTGEVKAANRIIRQFSQTLSDFGLQQTLQKPHFSVLMGASLIAWSDFLRLRKLSLPNTLISLFRLLALGSKRMPRQPLRKISILKPSKILCFLIAAQQSKS